MKNLIDLAAIDPQIEAEVSERLQEAVSERCLAQTEQVILASTRTLPDPADAIAAVLAFVALPRDRLTRVLLHPTFQYWLRAMRRTSCDENTAQRIAFARRIADFIWSEQALAGQLVRPWVVTTDERGGLRCPSLGRFIELGPGYAGQSVTIAPGDDRVILRCHDGMTIQIPLEDLEGPLTEPPPTLEEHGYLVRIAPRIAEGRVEVSTRDPWLRVRLTGTDQRTTGIEFFGSADDIYSDSPPVQNLEAALGLLKLHWREAYDDLSRFTRVVVPADFGPHLYRAFTVSTRQGAIYIGDAPPDPTVEMLLHENAHVKLRQFQVLDPLLFDPLDESLRIPVPWRPDPRPIPGIFEGVFVFSHVAEFESRRLRTFQTDTDLERLTKRTADLKYAVSCLEEHGKFTEAGRSFFLGMERWVCELSTRIGARRASQ